MRQLEHRAFLVQVFLLILPHAEDLLVVKRLEPRSQLKVRSALERSQLPRHDPERHTVAVDPVARAPVLLCQDFAPLIVIRDPSLMRHLCRDLSVGDTRLFRPLVVFCVRLPPVPRICHIDLLKGDLRRDILHFLRERPVVRVHLRHCAHAHAQGVCSPRLDPHRALSLRYHQSVSLLIYSHPVTSSPYFNPFEPVAR